MLFTFVSLTRNKKHIQKSLFFRNTLLAQCFKDLGIFLFKE